MMGYRVHRENNSFKVVEVNEGEIRDIMIGIDEKHARDTAKFLNTGGSFDGWTPNFFLNKLAPSV